MNMINQESGLAPYATKASQSRGRLVPELPSASRTPFQRDKDRIIHSHAFRKMRNKTQVFIESEGDYYRTRLTHSLEVAQIARSISRVLGLDEDLTEAIALAHDLGHTCFGHAGEDGLDRAMKGFGGFNHNEQTFRILTTLENRYARFDGLNLTWEMLEGVAKHNGPLLHDMNLPTIHAFSKKWDLELESHAAAEAQIAALSDDIAYNTHDADDGHYAKFFTLEELGELPLFGPSLKEIKERYTSVERQRLIYEAVRDVIGVLVNDVINTTQKILAEMQPQSAEDIRHAGRSVVTFSDAMIKNIDIIHQFLHTHMYRHENVNEVCDKARMIVNKLFVCYWEVPDRLPMSWANAVKESADDDVKARIIADYIAGMTDRFAVREYRRIFNSDIHI
ncbi:MAG: deoxyguanosinetriphosphate triphosphohydrolase [Alphaproteobacteria bacterium]|nr:deoxyguanosinetriphosphate triphosphohydrolase [Alphaproteobacteria bacterium]